MSNPKDKRQDAELKEEQLDTASGGVPRPPVPIPKPEADRELGMDGELNLVSGGTPRPLTPIPTNDASTKEEGR